MQTRRKQGENLTISRAIFEIITSSNFWKNLALIAEILEPYTKILNVLQCDKARLFQVLHSLGYLVQFWANYSDETLAVKLIDRLE